MASGSQLRLRRLACRALLLPLLALTTLGTGHVAAAGAPNSVPETQQPSPAATPPASGPAADVRAMRLAGRVHVDGVLDEPVWQNGNAVTSFHQRDPNEGAPATLPSEVRVAYDDEAIYVGARMHDPAPDSILARLTRRDVDIPADRFIVYLDPLRDRRSGYYFMLNAGGTQFDGTLSNDGWEDSSWDGVWEGRVRLDERGWSCEMRIPYSQLRFAGTSSEMTWGINFGRVIQRRNENAYLVFEPKQGSGFVSRFPGLTGLSGVTPGGSLEILPYVTGKAEWLADGSKDQEPNAGFDLRSRLGSRLTLNGTVNPDFGQVEVDPAVVNLSDVETFYPEKRPFFVEGSANFRFGNEGANDYWGFNWPEPIFFYSRRIGGRGERILGAAKMTGKIASSVNLGSVGAVTNEVDEPVTAWGDVRLLKEFRGRRAGLGFKVNGTVRDFDEPGLEDAYNRSSLMTGLDGWWFLDRHRNWVLSGWTGLSHITGTQARILDVQRSSRHYLQRPDADVMRLDPEATSMSGTGARIWLNKQNGRSFGNAAVGFMSPTFDVNDIGFMSYADVVNAHVGGGYKWTRPTKRYKYQNVIAAVYSSWNVDGNRANSGLYISGETEFQNNFSWNYQTILNPGGLSARRTRGGPLMKVNPGVQIGTYFDTDGKKPLFYYVEFSSYWQPSEDSNNWVVEPGVEWKPASNVTLRVGPSYSQVKENAQYITTYEDPLATVTYGNRYVFARLEQRTLAANIRLNVAFNPSMSLQFYGQPLVSIGEYTGYKALAAPGTYDFVAVPIADGSDNFNYKSLLGNAVFRWEYRPGSTLYLVWSHQRENDAPGGSFDFSQSFGDLMDTEADNIFLAKLTYYFSL